MIDRFASAHNVYYVKSQKTRLQQNGPMRNIQLGLSVPSAARALIALHLALVCPAVLSAEANQPLHERRLGVIKGTTPGIVILEFGRTPNTAAAASAVAGGEPGRSEIKPDASASQPGWASRWLGKLPPPSGRPLNDARRLDAPDQGIAVPSAASAAQPTGVKGKP